MIPRDRMAMAALVLTIPVDDVDRAVAGVTHRQRSLPPWVTAYHVLASGMDPGASVERVTDLLWATLPGVTGRGLAHKQPTRAAVTHARHRLGVEPMTALLAGLLARSAPPRDVRLERVEVAPELRVWALVSETGRLCGVDVRGDDRDAAAQLLRDAGLAAPKALPDAVAPPPMWQAMRTRTPSALRQEVVARACVEVAATHFVRGERVTK